jgi:hypothetical protein
MNGKRAKFLRHLALSLTAVHTEVSKETLYRQHTKRGNIVVAPKCVRGAYQQLKVKMANTILSREVRTQHHRIREQAA